MYSEHVHTWPGGCKDKTSGCGVREVLGPGVYNLGLVCPGSATAFDLELVTCPSLTLASNVKRSPRALRWWLGSIWPQLPPSPFPEDETWGGARGDSGSLPQCESHTLCKQKGEGGLLHHLCSWTPSWQLSPAQLLDLCGVLGQRMPGAVCCARHVVVDWIVSLPLPARTRFICWSRNPQRDCIWR